MKRSSLWNAKLSRIKAFQSPKLYKAYKNISNLTFLNLMDIVKEYRSLIYQRSYLIWALSSKLRERTKLSEATLFNLACLLSLCLSVDLSVCLSW